MILSKALGEVSDKEGISSGKDPVVDLENELKAQRDQENREKVNQNSQSNQETQHLTLEKFTKLLESAMIRGFYRGNLVHEASLLFRAFDIDDDRLANRLNNQSSVVGFSQSLPEHTDEHGFDFCKYFPQYIFVLRTSKDQPGNEELRRRFISLFFHPMKVKLDYQRFFLLKMTY